MGYLEHSLPTYSCQEVHEVDFFFQMNVPESEAIFVDELESNLLENAQQHREILELLLSGKSEFEVSELKQCNLRTVYRVIEQLQSRVSN